MINNIESADSAPQLLEELIRKGESAGASDIHLQMDNTTARVAFRLDGVLTPISEIREPVAERVFGRIKFLARLKTYQESIPQDGRISKAEANAQNDIRVSTYPAVTGEKIVLRLFNQTEVRSLDQLEFPYDLVQRLKRFLQQSSGFLLLTGPVGSGKTTTIYACLHHLAAQGGRHIITIEDPVEQIIPGVMQTEVNEANGLTFARAAKHLLRQDPQVLVVGEMRDEETVQLAVRAALTGHLVISTLHAGSCKGVFERLLCMCPDHHAVTSSIELVLNQRLIRRLCKMCKGSGCDVCFETGYRGRVPIVECLAVNAELRKRIRSIGPDTIQPDISLSDAARDVIARGLSDLRECQRILPNEMG